MQYLQPIVPGVFCARPNRFIAHIEIGGKMEVCHVKNTGRCRELLPQGATVYCADCLSSARKTRYDLIAVQKGNRLINMDSQAPNAAVKEWLLHGGLGNIQSLKPETTFWQRQIRKFLCRIRCNSVKWVTPYSFFLMLRSGSPVGLPVFLPS